jgi:hypothetical protein
MHHAQIDMYRWFSEVLCECYRFLYLNPKEFILMALKPEHTEEKCTRSYEDTVRWYIGQNPNFWYTKESIPTLGEARGKIVLINRFKGTNLGIPFSGDLVNHNLDTWEVDVREFYQYWVRTEEQLEKARNDDILYLSGASGFCYLKNFPLGLQRELSGYVNPKVRQYFVSNKHNTKLACTVLMDFPDQTTIDAVMDQCLVKFGIEPLPIKSLPEGPSNWPIGAWVELHDDTMIVINNQQVSFLSTGDRVLTIKYPNDVPDMHNVRSDDGKKGFNDKVSRVVWRIPVGWKFVLYDDKNYTDTSYPLIGTGKLICKNIESYFNDKCSSGRWERN